MLGEPTPKVEIVETHEVEEEEGSSSMLGDNDSEGGHVDAEEQTKVSIENQIELQVEKNLRSQKIFKLKIKTLKYNEER